MTGLASLLLPGLPNQTSTGSLRVAFHHIHVRVNWHLTVPFDKCPTFSCSSSKGQPAFYFSHGLVHPSPRFWRKLCGLATPKSPAQTQSPSQAPFRLGELRRERPIVPAATRQRAGCSPWGAEKPPPRWILPCSVLFCFWYFLPCCTPCPGTPRRRSACLLTLRAGSASWVPGTLLSSPGREGMNVSPTYRLSLRWVTQQPQAA